MEEQLRLAEAQLQLAGESLAAARLVAASGLYRNAIGHLYYAAYHGAVALLAAHGIEATSHDGVQTMFSLHFVKPGAVDKNAAKLLGNLLHVRLTADYKGLIAFDESDHASAASQATSVLTTILDYLARNFPQLTDARLGAELAALLHTQAAGRTEGSR